MFQLVQISIDLFTVSQSEFVVKQEAEPGEVTP